MSTIRTSRPAIKKTEPSAASPGGNLTTETRPRAMLPSTSSGPTPGGTNYTRQAIMDSPPKDDAPAGVDARPTSGAPSSMGQTSGVAQLAGRHGPTIIHGTGTASDQPADRQDKHGTHGCLAVGSDAVPGPAANRCPTPTSPPLLDPALALAADMLDDIERVRIANENRLRQLTRSVEDKDGETRGFGLDESHPDVARLAAIVATLAQVEVDATRHLEKVMRRHPLHGWAKSMRGVGDKQVARLLASIGDPYWRPEIVREDGTVVPAGPRTVSALWAYCGLHTLPVGQPSPDAQNTLANGVDLPAGQGTYDTHGHPAGRDQLAARHLGQGCLDAQAAGVWVAARRQRGQKANWSTKAKMRAYLIAESCHKQLVKPCTAGEHAEDCRCSPYRLLYEQRKANTEGRVHAVACVRCGPSGKPAQPGTPWSDGHRHADALRIVAKRILRDLWREAERIHETPPPGHYSGAAQVPRAGRGVANEDPSRVASADGSPTQTAQPWKETV